MENILEAGKMTLKWSERMQGFDISKDGTKIYVAGFDDDEWNSFIAMCDIK